MKKLYTIVLLSVIHFALIAQISHTINTGGYYYTPSTLTIEVGDSVIWINDGGLHDVNGDINTITGQSFNNPVPFDSPSTNTVGAVIFAYKFTVPGTYNYDCSVGTHAQAGMVGSLIVNTQSTSTAGVILKGVLDLDLPTGGSTGKAVHIKALQSIPDLSIYGIGIANNGGGTDGQEYIFPSISLNTGENLIVCRDTAAIISYFIGCNSFDVIIQDDSSVITQNGDDAIELFENGIVIETFGDINVDGTGEPWEYKDSWSYKDSTGSVTFNGSSWVMGGVDCSDGSTTSLSSNCPYPYCSSQSGNNVDITFNVDMSQNLDPFNTPELNSTFNNWCGNCNQLTDVDGDDIWELTVSLNPGDTIEYKFSADNWAFQETLDSNESCTNGLSNFTNRFLIIPTVNTNLDEVCWGSCSPCATGFQSIDSYKVNVYPNPTSNELFISSVSEIKYLEIHNSLGQKVYGKSLKSLQVNLDISNFSNDFYTAKVVFEDNVSIVNFIKN